MNVLFCIIIVLSACIFMIQDPQIFLSSMLDGASKSAVLCFSLIATYAVWLGLMRVWQDSGLTSVISKRIRPFTRKLLATDDLKTLDCLTMNLTVNLLGISGAATPYGIQGAKLLDKTENAEYSSAMFFVLNATSLQVIPTSVIGVRTALKSAAPTDIVLPTILTSAFSTLLAACLVFLLIPKNAAVRARKNGGFLHKRVKIKGAGMQ